MTSRGALSSLTHNVRTDLEHKAGVVEGKAQATKANGEQPGDPCPLLDHEPHQQHEQEAHAVCAAAWTHDKVKAHADGLQ